MEEEKNKKPEFKYRRSKVRDTDTEVVIVSDATDENRDVCMIHPESGCISFKFRGRLTDFGAGLRFYSPKEIQVILDKTKKLHEAYIEGVKIMNNAIFNLDPYKKTEASNKPKAEIWEDNEGGYEILSLENSDYIAQEIELIEQAIEYAEQLGFEVVNKDNPVKSPYNKN